MNKVAICDCKTITMEKKIKQKYTFEIYNGRVKVKYNGCVIFTFNQIDFLGYYFYKNDEQIYGCDIYLLREKAGKSRMDIYFKTREAWLSVNKLLDKNL